MTISILGFRPPEEEYKQKIAVYFACKKAGVSLPREIEDFFQDQTPTECGITINLEEWHGCCSFSRNEMTGEDVYRVHLNKLPKGVEIIIFKIS